MEFHEISFDYAFPRKVRGGSSITVLVGRERKIKMIIAHMVPMKGAGVGWIVDQVARDIKKLGIHGKVIIKSDQENAIMSLLTAVAKSRGADEKGNDLTVLEFSKKSDSQSNGLVEQAVQEIENGLRTQLLDKDSKLPER